MGCVGVGESARTEDVQADAHLDVDHAAELPALDAAEDLLWALIEEVIVVLHQRTPGLLGTADELLQLGQGGRRRLLDDDVGAGVERIHRQPEMRAGWGGDVDHRGTYLGEHRPVIRVPARDPVPLGRALGRGGCEIADRRHLHAGDALETAQVLPGNLSRADQGRLHVCLPSRIR